MPRESQDSFAAFMATAARYPLLTHLEEVELAQEVQAYFVPLQAVKEALTEQLDREPTTSEWAEAAQITPETLTKQWLQGYKARERLICCNLRLIIHVAKKHQGKGIEIPDLVQEGTTGLHKAVEKFNPAKGHRFSTYAYAWIKQSILRGIEKFGRPIRLPNDIHELLRAAKKTVFDYRMAHGRYPTTEELGLALLEAGKLRRPHPKKGVDGTAAAIEKFDRILAISRDVLSLNSSPTGTKAKVQDDDLELGNIVECSRPRPEAVAAERDQRMFTEELLRTLPAKHRAVLVARYGLDGSPPQPYAQIGAAMGMGTRSAKTMHDRVIRNLRAKVGDSDFVELLRGA